MGDEIWHTNRLTVLNNEINYELMNRVWWARVGDEIWQTNRLTVLNNEINYEPLNVSFNTYKLTCKEKILEKAKVISKIDKLRCKKTFQ